MYSVTMVVVKLNNWIIGRGKGGRVGEGQIGEGWGGEGDGKGIL